MAYPLYICILYIHVYVTYVYTVYSQYVYPILYICDLCTLYGCVCRLLDSGVTIQNTQPTPYTLVYTHTIYIVHCIQLYVYSTTHYILTSHIYCIHIVQCTQYSLYTGYICGHSIFFILYKRVWHIHYTYAYCISMYMVHLYIACIATMYTVYYTNLICILCMGVCAGYQILV